MFSLNSLLVFRKRLLGHLQRKASCQAEAADPDINPKYPGQISLS